MTLPYLICSVCGAPVDTMSLSWEPLLSGDWLHQPDGGRATVKRPAV